MSTVEFYREQEARDMRLAAETLLPSVRERCERSAAAWRSMAERQENTDVQRAVRLAERAAAA
jgi:hypothetical protein